MILLVALALGIVGVVWGLLAARNTFRNREMVLIAPRLRAYPVVVVFGLALACGSAFVRYPLKGDTVVYGFPFMSAIFQRHNGQWADFVGPLTFPAFVANGIFFFLAPQIALDAVIRKRARRKSAVV
jgi:hypothetical protein